MEFAIWFVKEYVSLLTDEHKSKIETLILKSKDAEILYNFVKSGAAINLVSFEDAIIAMGNAKYIYMFTGVSGIDVKKLEDAIVKTFDFSYIRSFAEYVKGANVRRLWKFTKQFGTEGDIISFKEILGIRRFIG